MRYSFVTATTYMCFIREMCNLPVYWMEWSVYQFGRREETRRCLFQNDSCKKQMRLFVLTFQTVKHIVAAIWQYCEMRKLPFICLLLCTQVSCLYCVTQSLVARAPVCLFSASSFPNSLKFKLDFLSSEIEKEDRQFCSWILLFKSNKSCPVASSQVVKVGHKSCCA